MGCVPWHTLVVETVGMTNMLKADADLLAGNRHVFSPGLRELYGFQSDVSVNNEESFSGECNGLLLVADGEEQKR